MLCFSRHLQQKCCKYGFWINSVLFKNAFFADFFSVPSPQSSVFLALKPEQILKIEEKKSSSTADQLTTTCVTVKKESVWGFPCDKKKSPCMLYNMSLSLYKIDPMNGNWISWGRVICQLLRHSGPSRVACHVSECPRTYNVNGFAGIQTCSLFHSASRVWHCMLMDKVWHDNGGFGRQSGINW